MKIYNLLIKSFKNYKIINNKKYDSIFKYFSAYYYNNFTQNLDDKYY